MRSDVVIRTRGLGKAFELYQRPLDRAKQFLLGKRGKYFEEFWAVRNVNLEIRRGESIGIIGRNGSGKSTILKIIAGVYIPTSGEVAVNGSIALDLPAGASAEVRAATVNGEVRSDFPLGGQARVSRRRLSGTIGGGGRPLALDTVNGSINIRQR